MINWIRRRWAYEQMHKADRHDIIAQKGFRRTGHHQRKAEQARQWARIIEPNNRA